MNNMKKYIAVYMLAMLACITSCDDSFLERVPLDQESEPTVFTTYDNFKKYAWGFYNATNGLIAYQAYPQDGDVSDLLYYSANTQGTWNYKGGFNWVFNLISGSNMDAAAWNFDYIRRVNIMLDKIDGSQMTSTDKEHWRGIGYFFRAHAYFELMKNYGELPWLEHTVGTGEAIVFGSRDSRELVANNILENLKYAEKNIYENGDGANTVNKNVVRALISRFGLWEGTWRKYHGAVDGVDGTKYLDASVTASKTLIDQNMGLVANYDDVFNSLSLANEKSVLLYRAYVANEGTDKGHNLTSQTRGDLTFEATKKLVEQYLCKDGKPISTSSKYDGDASIYDEFRNRDNRLYYTICPPYKVTVSSDLGSWNYTANTKEREYLDLMDSLIKNSNSGIKGKVLPLGTDQFIERIPNLSSVPVGGGIVQQTGYYMYKYYNSYDGYKSWMQEGTDAPIFRMGEVLINHAEAMFELGRFDQSVAEITINKLRARAGGVDKMIVTNIDANFDTYRDSDVAPVLWEIRRERCVELMGSGFRFQDLKRWGKGEYLNALPVGVKLEDDLASYTAEEAATLSEKLYNGADNIRYKNCITYMVKPIGWESKYYLFPIPQKQTTLNPALLPNNPGW